MTYLQFMGCVWLYKPTSNWGNPPCDRSFGHWPSQTWAQSDTLRLRFPTSFAFDGPSEAEVPQQLLGCDGLCNCCTFWWDGKGYIEPIANFSENFWKFVFRPEAGNSCSFKHLRSHWWNNDRAINSMTRSMLKQDQKTCAINSTWKRIRQNTENILYNRYVVPDVMRIHLSHEKKTRQIVLNRELSYSIFAKGKCWLAKDRKSKVVSRKVATAHVTVWFCSSSWHVDSLFFLMVTYYVMEDGQVWAFHSSFGMLSC